MAKRDRFPVTFWQKVDTSAGPEDCWPWTGRLDKDGYAVMSTSKRFLRASRVAFELAGGAVPDGHVMRHDCDNRLCVNARHLRTGTPAENIADKVARNRQAKGERMAGAKLTDEGVRLIRSLRMDGVHRKVIATRFGVSPDAVYQIEKGITWKHVV